MIERKEQAASRAVMPTMAHFTLPAPARAAQSADAVARSKGLPT